MFYAFKKLRCTTRRALALAVLALFFSATSHAASCGTVAAPLACSVTVGGVVKYTFNNFALVTASGSGGGKVYTAGDITIDVSAPGGNSARLIFNKLSTGPTPGASFAANAGHLSSFTFQYNVTIEAAGFGGVMYGSPFIVDLIQQSAAGNGLGTLQLIVGTPAATCQAITGAVSNPANCIVAGGQAATITAGNIVTLSGGTGNVSIGQFSNTFDVATASGQGLDIDGNGSYGATTDGLLAIRYLLGLRGAALITGAVGGGATRSTSTAIQQYLLGLTTP